MTENAAGRRTPIPRLVGTGYLADDLYLIAHHERTGRLLLSPRAAGLGLVIGRSFSSSRGLDAAVSGLSQERLPDMAFVLFLLPRPSG